MKMRTRLVGAGLCTVATFMVLLVVGWVGVRARVLPALHDANQRKAESTVSALASLLVSPLAKEETKSIQRVLAPLRKDAALIAAVVVDPEGRELVRIGGAAPVASLHRRNIAVEGLPLGSVAVGFRDTHSKALNAWMGWAAGAALIVIVLVGIVGFAFARSFTSPIHTMIAFAGTVSNGELDERLDAGRSDELGELARHLNKMTGAIQAREDNLHRARAELMQSTRLASVGEVAGRTAHEVLNPISSVHGRLGRVASIELPEAAELVELLSEIVGAWRMDYEQGGIDRLVEALEQPSELSATGHEPTRSLFAEDLENLTEIAAALRSAHEERTEDVRFMQREIDRIVRIVDGMRSMTRAFGSKKRETVRALLAEAQNIVADAAAKRNIRLVLKGDLDTTVHVDRHEMLQVLANLLRNAMMAIEDRRGRSGGTITLAAENTGEHVLVRVVDNGCGIAPTDTGFLFEPGFTTRSAKDGTGLGLSISRRLVRGAGGELTLEESVEGTGATFLISLPAASMIEEKHERATLTVH